MEIKSTVARHGKPTFNVTYQDIESEKDFGDRKIASVHAYCFCKDKLVVVYAETKGYWTPPGGGVDEGEDARTAVIREVKEETNMNVLAHQFIGMQDIFETDRVNTQTRSVCIVEPFGDFKGDTAPDAEITEIKLIDPKDYKEYFDWGAIGDHLMERALTIKDQMQAALDMVK